jgi:hypothetical protein
LTARSKRRQLDRARTARARSLCVQRGRIAIVGAAIGFVGVGLERPPAGVARVGIVLLAALRAAGWRVASIARGCKVDGRKRLLKAGLELADPVQQLTDEHGAGVVEREVTA